MRDFGATGVITAVDEPMLRIFCESVARYLEASRMLAQSSPLVRGRGARLDTLVRNPLHQVVRDNAVMARLF
jgi:hypothetical protein